MQEMQEQQFQSLGWEDPLEEAMTTHSIIFVVKSPWTEEHGRPQSMGCKELDTNEANEHALMSSLDRLHDTRNEYPKFLWSKMTDME